jgi:hypothetical protein
VTNVNINMKNEYKRTNKVTEVWRRKEEKIKGKEKRGVKVKKGEGKDCPW